MVFGICRLIDLLVPDVPESLQLKIKRERYLAKQALADADTSLVVGHVRDCVCVMLWIDEQITTEWVVVAENRVKNWDLKYCWSFSWCEAVS